MRVVYIHSALITNTDVNNIVPSLDEKKSGHVESWRLEAKGIQAHIYDADKKTRDIYKTKRLLDLLLCAMAP